jgi:hypothetical protein
VITGTAEDLLGDILYNSPHVETEDGDRYLVEGVYYKFLIEAELVDASSNFPTYDIIGWTMERSK